MIPSSTDPNGNEAAPSGSLDVLVERLLHVLAPLPSVERAHAYVQANKWHWPDVLAAQKPEKWDEMTWKQKCESREGLALWRALVSVTSEFERTRQWWREHLNRTDDEHLEWWKRTAFFPASKDS